MYSTDTTSFLLEVRQLLHHITFFVIILHDSTYCATILYTRHHPAGRGRSGSPPYWAAASGMPAMDVATDRMPDSTVALPTICQLTSPITAAVPIVATNVCAMVLTARIPAALIHATVSTSGRNTQFFSIFIPLFLPVLPAFLTMYPLILLLRHYHPTCGMHHTSALHSLFHISGSIACPDSGCRPV